MLRESDKKEGKIKVEIHLSKLEGKVLDMIVEQKQWSRKKWCEDLVRKALLQHSVKRKKK